MDQKTFERIIVHRFTLAGLLVAGVVMVVCAIVCANAGIIDRGIW